MYLTIIDDQSDEILYQRELGDNEHLENDLYADWFAAEYFDALVSHGGDIPLGCGHFTVELAEEPRSAVCWSARSYFVDDGVV